MKRKKIIAGILLCAYLTFIVRRLFFHAYGSYYRSYGLLPQYNLVPFKTIMSLIRNYKYYEFDVWIYNFFGNIAAFVPLGLLLPAVFSFERRFASTLVFSALFLLAAEAAQLILRVGVFDVDDIILNMIGVVSGYVICKLVRLA